MKALVQIFILIALVCFSVSTYGAREGKVGKVIDALEAITKSTEENKNAEKNALKKPAKDTEEHEVDPNVHDLARLPQTNCSDSSVSSEPSTLTTNSPKNINAEAEPCLHSSPQNAITNINSSSTSIATKNVSNNIDEPQRTDSLGLFAENIGASLIPAALLYFGLWMIRKSGRTWNEWLQNRPPKRWFFISWIGATILAMLIGSLGIQLLSAAAFIYLVYGLFTVIISVFKKI